jgi:hypothetical protein
VEIPEHIIRAANRDVPIRGRVRRDAHREPISDPESGKVVGFVTPHEGGRGFRLGPIYVLPEHRGRGHATRAVLQYRDRGLVHYVPDSSPESDRMHLAAGFEVWYATPRGTWYRLPREVDQ